MWVQFELTRKNHKNGKHNVVLDGLQVKTAVKSGNEWYIGNERIDKNDIFYIDIPEESSRVILKKNIPYRYKVSV